jgi:hypothetical protein
MINTDDPAKYVFAGFNSRSILDDEDGNAVVFWLWSGRRVSQPSSSYLVANESSTSIKNCFDWPQLRSVF